MVETENNIVLTGGHAATTAYALVEEIKFQKKNWKIFFIGSSLAVEGKKVPSLESEILSSLGVKFIPINAGRLQRKFTKYTIPSILKIPFGFIESFFTLRKIKPKLVLSFGGYASAPVVLSAKILGIPLIVHEQTSVVGRSTLFSAKFADKIAVSRQSSLKWLPKEKCILTGNPVIKEIQKISRKEIGKPPTIFIEGGSRGSQFINSLIEQILPELTSKYKVIHQTGDIDYAKFNIFKNPNYLAFPHVEPLGMSDFYKKCDVIISRAGANTVAEIIMVKRPAILIPLPISFLDEQLCNAKYAESLGIAKILTQDKLGAERLLKETENMIKDYALIEDKIAKIVSPDAHASEKLVSLISEFLH